MSSSISYTHSKFIHRIAVGSLFFLHGLCFSSWASRIPDIQQKLRLSESELGAILFAIPVGLMASLPLAGWLVAKVGSYRVVVISIVVYGAVLVTLGLSTSILQLILCLFFYGMAGNMVNIAVNTQAVGVEQLYQKSIMASFHGLWSVAGFTGASVGALMIGEKVLPQLHFIVILSVLILIVIISSRYILKKDPSSTEDQPIFAIPDKSLLKLGVIAFCTMICEGAMFDWSGVYFKKVVQAEPSLIGAGYTAFMSTMATGRFIADSFTSKFGLKRTLQLSGILTALGLIISVAFPTFVFAIIGFLLVGFGVSSVVPLVYGAAGKSKKLSAGVAIAAVSTIGFLGFLIGPPLIGIVAGATDLRVSFSIIALMGISISILATISKSISTS
jgi:MFS family permease